MAEKEDLPMLLVSFDRLDPSAATVILKAVAMMSWQDGQHAP